MKSAIVRSVSIRVVAFFLALSFGLGLALFHHVYVHRQAAFTDAAFMGRHSRLKVLYRLGVDVNAPGCEFRTCFNAIWGAAYGGYDDEIEFLLARGADPNTRPSKFRTTALMVAAYQGHESTVRLLLSKGADANVTIDGDTALSLAKDKGNTEIVDLLKQVGALDTP
jgi:ankyrin repeat protein